MASINFTEAGGERGRDATNADEQLVTWNAVKLLWVFFFSFFSPLSPLRLSTFFFWKISGIHHTDGCCHVMMNASPTLSHLHLWKVAETRARTGACFHTLEENVELISENKMQFNFTGGQSCFYFFFFFKSSVDISAGLSRETPLSTRQTEGFRFQISLLPQF